MREEVTVEAMARDVVRAAEVVKAVETKGVPRELGEWQSINQEV